MLEDRVSLELYQFGFSSLFLNFNVFFKFFFSYFFYLEQLGSPTAEFLAVGDLNGSFVLL